MKNSEKNRKVSIEEIEELAVRGEDVTQFFNWDKGQMKPGFDKVERVQKDVQRVNVDFANEMLSELDQQASELNISRQAVIKSLVREGLDRRHLAKKARRQA